MTLDVGQAACFEGTVQFRPITLRRSQRVNWSEITHLRLTGRATTTPHAELRRATLAAVADADGLVELAWALQHLEPYREAASREQGVKTNLRHWANSPDHGTTDQDKGWLELGYLA